MPINKTKHFSIFFLSIITCIFIFVLLVFLPERTSAGAFDQLPGGDIYVPPVNGPVREGDDSNNSEQNDGNPTTTYSGQTTTQTPTKPTAQEEANQYVKAGNTCMDRGEYSGAIENYDRAFTLNPNDENVKQKLHQAQICVANENAARQKRADEAAAAQAAENAEQVRKAEVEQTRQAKADKERQEKLKKAQDFQKAEKMIEALDLRVQNLQGELKVCTKALMNNKSEFETWKATFDNSIKDSQEKGTDYLISLPYEIGTAGLSNRIEARIKDLDKGSILALDKLSNTGDKNLKEQYRAFRHMAKRERAIAEFARANMKKLKLLKTYAGLYSFDSSKREDGQKLIEGLGWLATIAAPPEIPMIAELYMNEISICYSYHMMQQTIYNKEEYLRLVKEMQYELGKNENKITQIKQYMKNYKEGVTGSYKRSSEFFTPPPILK
jgi:hypothetical protein